MFIIKPSSFCLYMMKGRNLQERQLALHTDSNTLLTYTYYTSSVIHAYIHLSSILKLVSPGAKEQTRSFRTSLLIISSA